MMRTVLTSLLIISMLIVCMNCQGKSCNSNQGCADNECCKSQAQVRGKRSTGASGICTPKGTLLSRCYRGGVEYYGNPPLLLNCPCAHGFQCNVDYTGPRNPPLGFIGVCGPE